MTRQVVLGAPSLTEQDANDQVQKEFAKAKYPMRVLVINHMPRNVVFPEVEGLYLTHCADTEGEGHRKEVTINNEDQLQRLASSIEQVAELNGYEKAIELIEVSPPAAKSSAKDKTVEAAGNGTAEA